MSPLADFKENKDAQEASRLSTGFFEAMIEHAQRKSIFFSSLFYFQRLRLDVFLLSQMSLKNWSISCAMRPEVRPDQGNPVLFLEISRYERDDTSSVSAS